MKKRKAKIFLLLLIYISAQVAYAAVDSTELTPQSTTKRKLCYSLVIDGVPVTGTAQDIAGIASTSCVAGTGGSLGFAGAVSPTWNSGGGDIGVTCPPDYPYVKSTIQGWGIGVSFWFIITFYGGGAGSSVVCCAQPMHTTSMTSAWETPDASGKCASGI